MTTKPQGPAGAVDQSPRSGDRHLSLWRYLSKYHGVGHARAMQICKEFGYLPTTICSSMSKESLARFNNYARVEGAVRDIMLLRIKRKVKAGTFAGIRIRRGLPARGQRTQTNASTAARLNKGLAL